MAAVLDKKESGEAELLSMNLVSSSSSHSERLFEAIDRVLKDSLSTIQDISKIIFSAGPGSFTGLRIAFSAVKGLALGADKEFVAVSTLKSLIKNIQDFDTAKAALIADTKGELFAYILDSNNNILLDETAIRIEELLQKIRSLNTKIQCIGTGAVLYSTQLSEISSDVCISKNKMMHIISPFSMEKIAELESLKDLNYIKVSYAENKIKDKK